MFYLKSYLSTFTVFYFFFIFSISTIYAQPTIRYCSSAAALNDILNNVANPGDILIVTEDLNSEFTISKDNGGTDILPIIIKAQILGGIKITKRVTFNDNSNNLVLSGFKFENGGQIYIDGSNIRITQCSFDSSCYENHWIWVENDHPVTSNIEIDHCLFEGKDNLANPGRVIQIALYYENNKNHYIHHNHFKDLQEGDRNGYETIQVISYNYSQDANIRIESNFFENCDTCPGDGEIISIKSSGNKVRYNVFKGCEGAVVFRHGHRNTADGNYFYGDGKPKSMGIRIQGEDQVITNNYFNGLLGKYAFCFNSYAKFPQCPSPYDQIKNAQVINNTWVDCDTSFYIQEPRPCVTGAYPPIPDKPPLNCMIINNIFQSNNTIFNQEKKLIKPVFDSNIYWGADLGLWSEPDGFQYIDPQLESNIVNVHVPLSKSPAIDNGSNLIYTPYDIFGNSRGPDDTNDIGAVEYPSDYMPRPPVNDYLTGSKGLVGYWSFSGNADDNSGYGSTSTVYGSSLTTDRNANPQSAYYFDGIDDYINIGNNDCIKPALPLTVAAWVYLDSSAIIYPIFLNNYVENYYYGVGLSIASENRLAARIGDGGLIGPSSRRSKRGLTNLDFNEWYFVAAVIKNATNIELYIDGVNDGGVYSGTGENEIAYNFEPGKVGSADASMHPGGEHNFKGKIDEIRLYNYDLTASEIYSIYNYTGSIYKKSSQNSDANNIVAKFELHQNYPNPFNSTTKIDYHLAEKGHVKITIFDVLGQQIANLVNDTKDKGHHSILWNADQLSSGVYFYKIDTGVFSLFKKMLLIK